MAVKTYPPESNQGHDDLHQEGKLLSNLDYHPNIINLLAAQWGDLYTNVGDITGAVSGSSSAETIVWVGSENRQHFMGHINLMGATGSPIFPMSTSGPTEGYIGDPTQHALG